MNFVKNKCWRVGPAPYGLAALATVVLLAGAELYFRADQRLPSFTEPSPRAIRLKEHRPLYHAELALSDEDSVKTAGLAEQSIVFRTDKDGFILPSAIHPDPEVVVVFLGGSTTECKFLPEEKRLPYLAGRILEEKTGKRINSYNAGVSGNHSLHSLNILLNKVIPLRPSLVVFNHNLNDLVYLLYMGSYWRDHPTRSLIITPREETGARGVAAAAKNLVRKTGRWLFPTLAKKAGALYLKLFPCAKIDEWADIRGQPVDYDLEKMEREFQANLQTFIDICRAREIEPILLTQASRLKQKPDPAIKEGFRPMELAGISYPAFREAHRRFNQVIREIANKNQVTLIDLEEIIPSESEYLYDLVHLNERGAEVAATAIAKYLVGSITK